MTQHSFAASLFEKCLQEQTNTLGIIPVRLLYEGLGIRDIICQKLISAEKREKLF